MRNLIFLAIIVSLLGIITQAYSSQEDNNLNNLIDEELNYDEDFYEYDDDLEVGSIKDKIKAAKCMMHAGIELQNLIQLYHDIIHFKIIDGFKLIGPLLKQIVPIADNCSVFFCMGPSIKKCEQEEKTTCSKYRLRAYPDCEEGYTNHGCCKCWPACPSGWKSFGRFCIKPKNYYRGVGYPLWDKKKCQKHHPQGCEQDGLLIYPKCDEGYHSHLFVWCSADCPKHFTHVGHSCMRPFKHYKRGHGYPMTVGTKCLESTKISEDATCDQILEEFLILQQRFDDRYEIFADASLDEEERYMLLGTEFFILLTELETRYLFIHENQCLTNDLIEIM